MRLGLLFSFVVWLISFAGVASAEVPKGWPWHGVSVNNLSASPQDIARLKKRLGLNVIRLQLQPRVLVDERKLEGGKAWDESLRWLDGMLDACKSEKIGCVVNISQFLFDPRTSAKHQHEPKFWEAEVFAQEVLLWVERLSEHTKNRGDELIAFDILSEPQVWMKGPKPPALFNDRLSQVVTSIRKYNSRAWVVISPAPMGDPLAYANFSPVKADRLIYGAHMYFPLTFTHQGINKWEMGVSYPSVIDGINWDKNQLVRALAPLRDFQMKNDALIWIGEFSATRWANGGEQYIQDLVSIFDEYGWGWAYFSATGWHGWNPDYNEHYSGNDKSSVGAWKNDYVGEQSRRWQTLHSIFKVQGK